MKKKIFLGMSIIGMVLGMTSCGDETSISDGNSISGPSLSTPSSESTPSVSTSTSPSVDDSTSPSVDTSAQPSTGTSTTPSVDDSTSPSVSTSASESGETSNSTSTVVPPEPTISIVSVSTKSSFTKFAENKMEKPTNPETEFIDKSREYVVGDDNRISVKPIVEFENEDGEPVSPETWSYSIDVQIKNGDQFVSLGQSDLNTYVDLINNIDCEIEFSEAAIGKIFRVVVTPDGLSSRQQQHIGRFQTSMDFEIVDGYNVYNAKELAYYDNSEKNKDAWTTFKTENGMDLTIKPSALILHDNIFVRTQDVPSQNFYNVGDEDFVEGSGDYDRTLGSLRDYVDVYNHFYSKDEKFTIYGNYYTLNFSEFPYVTRENGKVTDAGKVISHANLFRSETSEGQKEDATCLFTMRDINLIGNAPKQENTILGGGLILNKSVHMEAHMENNISRMWFITYFSEMDDYTINKCKAYDNFNSFIYNWGGNVTATDSEMIGAGGPVILQDHIKHDSNGEGGYVGRSTFTRCKLESVVAGTEGWFDLVGASALSPSIKDMNDLFKTFGSNFVFEKNDAKMFNLISVNKSGNAQTVTPGIKIKGSVKIDDCPAFDFGETNPYLKGFIEGINAATGGEAPIFQSTGGNDAFVFTDRAHLFAGFTSDKTPIPVTADHSIFKGDYICIYYQGMCFSFAYTH